MRSASLTKWLFLVLFTLGWLSAAWGDALVVGGQRSESREAFVMVGEEVYAPLLPALSNLGARYQLTADAIKITTATQREVIISRTRPEATLDGMVRDLPGAPRKVGGSYLLPARAVGSLLGCAVRWDVSSRTLFIHPWVRKFTLQSLPDRYRLTVGAEAPVAFRTGKVENPPRFYIDLIHADLATIPAELKLEDETYLKAARARQNTLWPAPEGDVVRVVVDLAEWKPYRLSVSPDRCTLQVDFPLPDSDQAPTEAPPVVLTALAFQRVSPRVASVRLLLFGKAGCHSGAIESPPSVWVEVANADNRLPTRHLDPRDRLVSEVSCEPAPDKPGVQRLTIKLAEPVPHTVISQRGEVRVLLGRTELADLKVVIDAGHGGHDTGAIGRTGLCEKDVNLDIALRVREQLEALGAHVLMTRTSDDPVIPWQRRNSEEHRRELLARCAIANDANADLFVSIHCNARAANSGAIRGTETYYRKQDSVRFAEVMQEELVGAVGLPDGGAMRHPKPIIVLYQTNMPAVLVEIGYLSHPQDEALLASDDLRQRAAQGIVNGIRRYVEEGGTLAGVGRGSAGAGESTSDDETME